MIEPVAIGAATLSQATRNTSSLPMRSLKPARCHRYEQRAIAAAQSKTRWCSPQSDGKLMAEKQILNFKPASRLEQIDDQDSERVQDCKHRSQWCDDSVLHESGPDGIFGRDNRVIQVSSARSLPCSRR
jgi:hypothetical protein